MNKFTRSLCCAAITVAFLTAPLLNAAPIEIIVGTSSLKGLSSDLAFDLLNGGPPSNSITISGFTTNGLLGAASFIGGVTGTFPGTVTLEDTSFFNEYVQSITLGTSLRFVFDTIGNPPDPTSSPDAFSLFFLNPLTGLPLFPTNDPTGGDALFLYSIGLAQPLELYAANAVTIVAQAPNAIPAAGTLALLLAGFFAVLVVRSTRNRAIYLLAVAPT